MAFNWLRKIWYKINPRYKDRLFCSIFGKEKYKGYALELYNAVNGTSHKNLSDLEIITLSDAVYLKMKNDVAYLICGTISLYEHQSSINPNMPIRGFMYMGELYSQLLKEENARIYNSSLVKIPSPQYIVFYNGTEEYPDRTKLKLSDAFINPRDDGDFEFTATVLNINLGKNSELLNSCEPLWGYSYFVDRVRKNSQTMKIKEAVDKAIKECIEKDILKDVLSRERAAVKLEMITEFNEKVYEEGIREEGREEERINTERERKRAEAAETRAYAAESRADAAETELAKYRKKYGDI